MVERLIVPSHKTNRLKTRFRYATEVETYAIAMEKAAVSVIDKDGAIMRVVHDNEIVFINLPTLQGWLGFTWASFSLPLQ